MGDLAPECAWRPTKDNLGYPMYKSEDCNMNVDLISEHPAADSYEFCPYCGRTIAVGEG